MTYFTPVIDKYLAKWILPETCLSQQDIEDNFYRFVIAINRFSRRIKGGRNPRTYDKEMFKKKVLLAVKQNHPDWDEEWVAKEVNDLSEKAMIILEALWFGRRSLVADFKIRMWNPPLK